MTMGSLYKTFKLFGYLFRVTEEQFGKQVRIDDDNLTKLLNSQPKPISERLNDAANYLDSTHDIDSVSIDGLKKEYLIVPEIISVFNNYIDNNINSAANQIINGKTPTGIKANYLQENAETFSELLYRMATWGYLYRIIEEQL